MHVREFQMDVSSFHVLLVPVKETARRADGADLPVAVSVASSLSSQLHHINIDDDNEIRTVATRRHHRPIGHRASNHRLHAR